LRTKILVQVNHEHGDDEVHGHNDCGQSGEEADNEQTAA
jgi:hypothetical protein